MAVWHEPSPGVGYSRYIAYAAGISRLLLRAGTVGERQPPVVRAGPATEPRAAQEMEKRTGRLVITMGFRIYLRALSIMGACRFDLKALDILQGESPMIIAPNHPSLMDALMVISRLPNLACIMKSELVDNVFFGAGARLAGYIRNDSLRGMIYLAVEDLRSGSHCCSSRKAPGATVSPSGPYAVALP